MKRSYEDFRVLDKHLHLCIYDRRFSQLPELPRLESLTDQSEVKSAEQTHCFRTGLHQIKVQPHISRSTLKMQNQYVFIFHLLCLDLTAA